MEYKYQKIDSQEKLDKLLKKEDVIDCFVQLNFGLRSSKQISRNDKGDYCIYNEIDDSEEVIKHSQLMKHFLGEAISKSALYKY